MLNNLKNRKYLSKNLDCNNLIDISSVLCIFSIQVILRSVSQYDLIYNALISTNFDIDQIKKSNTNNILHFLFDIDLIKLICMINHEYFIFMYIIAIFK